MALGSKYSDLKFGKDKKTGHTYGYCYYKDVEGKRRQTKFTSKKKLVREAKAEIQEWYDDLLKAEQSSLSLGAKHHDKTVEQVVREYIDYQHDNEKMEDSTYVNQMSQLEINAFPYIGGVSFYGLTKDAINSWITKLNEKGLKQGTIHGIYAHVAKVYKHWYKQAEIRYNPFEFVDTPSKSESKKTFLDPPQMERLFECLNEQYNVDHPLYTAVNLAALAGLRRGEICGLRWYDLDLQAGYLTVSSAIGVANGTYTKAPKNRSSVRTFPIVPQLVDVLRARYKYVKETYGTVESGWFVCGEAVKYYAPTCVSRDFKKFVTENKLVDHYGNEVKLHSLRHNFATLGVKSHMDIASLSRMMGHASKAMTLDTYADTSPLAMKAASAQLADSFQNETWMLEFCEEETPQQKEGQHER